MTRYRIDPERSRVVIDASSSLHPIHSESTGLEGWLEMEGDAVTAAHLELPVARLASGNPILDREMRRRIDARRNPTIDGELTEMSAAGGARGDITFRGVTRQMEGELTVALDGERTVRVSGERVFDVRDFDFEPPKVLMLKVHPEVKVRIDVVAKRAD